MGRLHVLVALRQETPDELMEALVVALTHRLLGIFF